MIPETVIMPVYAGIACAMLVALYAYICEWMIVTMVSLGIACIGLAVVATKQPTSELIAMLGASGLLVLCSCLMVKLLIAAKVWPAELDQPLWSSRPVNKPAPTRTDEPC